MKIPNGYTIGTFISEDKNRFRCTVNIDGTAETCYIASSCRLDNFIDLVGKTVLLKPTNGSKAEIRHAVFAVKHKRSYILLNSMLANTAIENSLHSRKLTLLGRRATYRKEFAIEAYKSDFYLPETQTVIEVKSVITTQRKAFFPTVHSERALKQLHEIEGLLTKGFNAHLIIVSLSPYVEEIEIPRDTTFHAALMQCIACGLSVSAFTCRLSNNGRLRIDRRIPWY